jgi:guanylate kinase
VRSWTTRPPRPGDGAGKSYEHVTRSEFEALRDDGRMLEWAEVHGQLYGTPREAVEQQLAEGLDVLLEIDVQGAKQVKAGIPGAVTIFLEPPSWEVLEERLRSRGTEDDAALARRLETARRELSDAGGFDHRVVNEDLAEAVDEVDRILMSR